MRMFFNVLAAIADLGTHQLAHGAVRHHGVLDRHTLQDASLGIHRRRGKLLGVHLAQALVALDGFLPRAARATQGGELTMQLVLGVGVDVPMNSLLR